RLRAIKRARRDHAENVMPKHVTPFLELADSDRPTWTAAALARVAKVPQMVRETVKAGIEDLALERELTEISLALAEEGVAEARKAMCPVPEGGPEGEEKAAPSTSEATPLTWTAEAEERLARVPEGFMRDMTKQRVENLARAEGADTVTLDLVQEKYAGWGEGSAKRQAEMDWAPDAAARIERIPDFIRGMVILEIERCAREMGLDQVTGAAIDKASESWEGIGGFHSESAPDQYKS
ncbi:MAG: PCP reductase family protein, partial [Alphaproteobacteria bacterium]|nr:PCP reductase family protein [Alphaproteobacteria bacterium]